MSQLDKPLEEIIKSRPKPTRSSSGSAGPRRGGRGGGPIRNNRGSSSRGRRNGGYSSFGRKGRSEDVDKWGHDGFELQKGQRSPPRQEDGEYGTKVKITNLHYDVLDEDLEELFGTVGNVAKVKVSYDNSGRSTGEAIVIFTKEANAEKAVTEFDGREIDGQAMRLTLEGQVRLGNRKPKPARTDDAPRGDSRPTKSRASKDDIDLSRIKVRVNFT